MLGGEKVEMNLRHKKKAFKKLLSALSGEPSGFGKMTPRERKASMDYVAYGFRVFARSAREAAQALHHVGESYKQKGGSDREVVG